MLQRCLASVISQTYRNWVAVVMDDSPDREGELVVTEFRNTQIRYQPNALNLGCCANLDQAFSDKPLMDGDFACVLEDDNWLLPQFFDANLDAVAKTAHRILLRNQWIAEERLEQEPCLTAKTTRGGVFGVCDRELSPLDIRSAAFFSQGLSNGGIFWALNQGISFVVGSTVKFSPMQEYCRSLRCRETVWFGAEPLAVFSLPTDGSTRRETLANRRFNRGRQAILSRLLSHHGEALVEAAARLARSAEIESKEISLTLADCGQLFQRGWNGKLLAAWTKGMIKRLLVRDPLESFWLNEGEEIIRWVEPDSTFSSHD